MSRARGRRGQPGGGGARSSTLELVLSASTELFAERGFAAATMRELAERAGLPLSAYYYYFRRKYDVLLAIMDTAMGRLEAAVEDARDPSLDPPAQLERFMRAHVRVHLEYPKSARVADTELRALTESDREAMVARRDLYERRFRRVLEEGVERGFFDPGLDISLASMAILTMGTSVVEWWRPDGRLTIDETAERLSRFALGVAGWREERGGRAAEDPQPAGERADGR